MTKLPQCVLRDTPLPYFLKAGFPEVGLQRETSIESESDFFHGRRMTGEESEEPAAGVNLGEGLGQGQVVMELPVVEMPALGDVGGGQVVEERVVHYAGEPPVAVLEEPPNNWEGDSVMGTRLQERPEDREVRPKLQPWRRLWRRTLGWRQLTSLPYSQGQH